MSLEIRREDHRSLSAYAAISIAFDVREAVRLPVAKGPLECRSVTPTYCKDYDATPGNHPRDWPTRFAVDRAELLAAYLDDERVGGAMIVLEPSDVARLGGTPPLALLWDLRVAREARGCGIGRTLLTAIEDRMRELGVPGIFTETQDINVAACRLYASAGYVITSVDAEAYDDFPHETQIIWTKRIG